MNETSDFLLVGDLNARTTFIGCRADTPSGNVLCDYLLNSDSVVINDMSNTYFRFKSDYEEKLDLFIGSSNYSNKVTEFLVHSDDLMGSDHAPVSCVIGVDYVSQKLNNGCVRLNYAKADWVLFKNILSQKAYSYSDSYLSSLDVNMLNKVVTDDILSSAKSAIPLFKATHKKSFPKHIIDLIQLKRQARKKVKSNFTDLEFKTEYNRLTSLLRSEIKKYTEEKWKRFLGKLGPYPVSSRSFWAIINKARENKKSNSIPTIKSGGSSFRTDLEKANVFSEILGEVFQDRSEQGQFDIEHKRSVEDYVSNIGWSGEDFESFSYTETQLVLNRLKVCTSPGDDRIHNILLKRLPASYVSKILIKLINLSVKTELPVSWKEAIITMIPKKDHKSSDPCDYRPTSLTNCVGKFLENRSFR
jgi:hypothetical protein